MNHTGEKKISVSVISENRNLIESLTDLIRATSENVIITPFNFESAFIESLADSGPDIIISDRSGSLQGWRIFAEAARKRAPDALLILIVPVADQSVTGEMISSGVYDVISHISAEKITPFIQRMLRDVDTLSNLRFLSREKDINDHIINCSRSMLSIINRNYIYEKVNATFCTAHNVLVDNIIGKTLSEIWGADTFRTKIKENIDLCLSGNTVRYEASFNTPYFGNRYFEVVFRPITGGDGQIARLLAETFDITDLKQSQKIVNEMKEEFKKIETNLPIGFLRCESDGTIIHANKAFITIMGCSDETGVTGLNIREFYAEKGLFDIHLRQLGNDQIKTFGRVSLFTCSGSEIACRISGFAGATEAGKPSYIDFAFEDSSREIMLENRLLQAQKLETIGALAGGLAHDFNNILSTILGYSELMLEEVPRNSPLSEKVIKIISAITRARSLTNQILTFSRQMEQQKITVNICEVLKETMGFIGSGKPENITLESDIKDCTAHVYADPTQLFRVFLNLMTNGIQAMEDRGGILRVGLDLVQGNQIQKDIGRDIVADIYALITIEDTGIGMEPSVMQRIFEPYFTTKEVGKGTGLGLSVSHGIIAEIEGEIMVSSRKDKGSVFSVYIPVTREFDTSGLQFSDKRLLIITGNQHESRILSLALEKSGYRPEFVSDILKLGKALADKAQIPDIIIYMDDSEDVKTDDIISLYSENRSVTPLILISDSEQYASKEKLLNSGIAKQVLIKPVSLREIHNAIQMSLI